MRRQFWFRTTAAHLVRHAPALVALVGSALLATGSSLPINPPPAPLPAAAVKSSQATEVIGYLPYWELNSATAAGLDYERLTAIVFFSVKMDRHGQLVTTAPGYRALMSDDATHVIDAAHEAGVRTLVSFTSFGTKQNARFFADAAARQTFVGEAAALVSARGLDGADLDVELLGGAWFDEYAATAGELAAAMRRSNPPAYSTVATNGEVSGALMAALAIRAGVDRAFLMGYDYRTAETDPVGSIDPLLRFDGGLSLSSSLDLYEAAGVPLDSVVLGLPLYGRTWETVDASLHARRSAGARGQLFLLRDLPQLRQQGTILADDFDVQESSGRLVREVGGKVYQTYYDSPRSLETKFGVATSRGLAGVGFWTLGYDGNSGAPWDLIPHD
jgi:GH18 family chitinase